MEQQTQQPIQQKATIIRADRSLQHKVGIGPIDQMLVENAQKVITDNRLDFAPYALQMLEKLERGLEKIDADKTTVQTDAHAHKLIQLKSLVVAPVMELKAHAGLFKYSLVGNLAGIMLSFLENLSTLDKDALEIVSAHHKTLHAIIVMRLEGEGGENGQRLMEELQQACDRYFHKRKV